MACNTIWSLQCIVNQLFNQGLHLIFAFVQLRVFLARQMLPLFCITLPGEAACLKAIHIYILLDSAHLQIQLCGNAL